ncbi:MAG: hypothetical protein KatS3mg108_3171 [Isosphaeraceae bacterium]|jgi:capsular exopolysaccharide synthesis family protein|nr:MAG: hypothetical protein KatS3mg108_3171 [Isosphaeraceae bacterium]
MDRIIAAYGAPHSPTPARTSAIVGVPPKTGLDYVRALRRRWWLALMVAVAVGGLGMVLVLKLPSIYQAVAEIEVVPPQFDGQLSVIVETPAHLNRDNSEQFVLNKVAQLRNKTLIDEVVRQFEPSDPAAAAALAAEISTGLTSKRIPGTSLFVVTLDSRDQDRVARLLNTLLTAAANRAYEEGARGVNASITKAEETLRELERQVEQVNQAQSKLLVEAPYLAANGRNFLEDEVLGLKSVLLQKKVRLDDLVHEQRLAQLWPHLRTGTARSDHPAAGTLAQLYQLKDQLEYQLEYLRRTVRSFRNDPYVKLLSQRLGDVLDQIEALQASQDFAGRLPDLAGMQIHRATEEIRELEEQLARQQVELRRAAPQFQTYLGLMKNREELELLIGHLRENLVKFKQVAATLKRPIEITQRAITPLKPARPNRVLGFGLAALFALVAGVGLVIALESCDRAIKAPEQLSAGLALPILGVIPRIRRHAGVCRGIHLWTPGIPDSLEADAFRNVRAGLLGLEWSDRPLVTILVTSPKAGDGKSTVALNLAAACARAGERTILVDCDLRRPSVVGLLPGEPNVGLVDVLRGELPLDHAIGADPELDNLDVLPAGELGGVPIEVLGSRELRDLLGRLARDYHRVILDAPAVLGLADGRILGRLADATVLVVRAGSHELLPLRRAKEYLEQSRAKIAGVVFNDLCEDFHHWSCDYSMRRTEPPRLKPPVRRRLAAPAPGTAAQ